ncbi:MAG TPA: hypothetical protein VFQ00_04750 [Terriglobales bacterium]|nr:hypothetical protein [Terriglobales bacterium]
MSSYAGLGNWDRGLSWSAIFGGTFVFLAIEVTFGVLGAAVFASATTPANGNVVTSGISTGVGIWAIVLSIIALYFAGRTAAVLSRTTSRHVGLYHGLVTYGMALFTTVLVISMAVAGTAATTANNAVASSSGVARVLADGGWWTFVALVLAMIAACIGGHQGGAGRAEVRTIDRNERPDVRQVA